MKFKQSFLYQLHTYIKPALIFLAIFSGGVIFMSICVRIASEIDSSVFITDNQSGVTLNISNKDPSEIENSISINGIEFATVVFTFVMGLASFKETLKFTLQNGVSRKTNFLGRISSSFIFGAAISFVITLVDKILLGIASLILNDKVNFSSSTLYQNTPFYGRSDNISEFVYILEGILLIFVMTVFIFFLGSFITTLMYRLNALGKTLVSAGTAVFIIIVLPYLDSLFNGAIFKGIFDFFYFTSGYKDQNPYVGAAFGLLGAFALAGFTYLLMRRAPIKK